MQVSNTSAGEKLKEKNSVIIWNVEEGEVPIFASTVH